MSQVTVSAATPSPEQDAGRRRKMISSVIVGSVVVHLIFGAAAAFWVVARYFAPAPATFQVQKNIQLPAEERQQRLNMAEFDALTPKPTLNEKLASIQPTDFALPDLPKVPMDQMLPLDPSAIVSEQVVSMVGTAGLGGGGSGAGGGMGGSGSGFSFLGIQAEGRRIMLMFDVSGSVVNKAGKSDLSMSDIKTKTLELIDSLGINSSFNLCQFTRNYMLFEKEMVPATDPNKASAKTWVEQKWITEGSMSGAGVVTNPTGILGLLQRVYEMKPDVIFVVSDGSFQRNDETGKNTFGRDVSDRELLGAIEEGEKESGQKVPFNFIGFEVKPADKSIMRRVTGRTGGRYKELR